MNQCFSGTVGIWKEIREVHYEIWKDTAHGTDGGLPYGRFVPGLGRREYNPAMAVRKLSRSAFL